MKKEGIIHDWEYLKNQLLMNRSSKSLGYPNDEEEARLIKTASAVFDRAVKEYGYNWASKNLKPIEK